MVIFVYGVDYPRQMNLSLIPKTTLLILITLFMSSIAITLYVIRRKCNLRRQGLISVAIDISIAFFGGGNLRMQHKFERLFFGILLVAAFFLISLFAGAFLDYIYRIQNQKVDTFNELATTQSPIYLITSLTSYSTQIDEMMRLVFTNAIKKTVLNLSIFFSIF